MLSEGFRLETRSPFIGYIICIIRQNTSTHETKFNLLLLNPAPSADTIFDLIKYNLIIFHILRSRHSNRFKLIF